MTTHPIDNSDNGYIERTILWQYDNAKHLKDLILNLKGFYDKSTKDHFDEMVERMNLADEDIDDYGLAVWGKILNTNRPNLTYIDEETSEKVTKPLKKGIYRKILLGKIKLFEGSATLKEFVEYIDSIFGDAVTCTDCPDVSPSDISSPDMSIRFYLKTNAAISNELDALITQAPDVVFVYPAGVRSSKYSDSPVIGFAEQVGLSSPSKPIISITNTTSKTITLVPNFWFIYAEVKYTITSSVTLAPEETKLETSTASTSGTYVPIGTKVLLHTNNPDTDEILYGIVLVSTPPDFNLETLNNGSIAWKR